jgi:Winged helix DNA-binding domain
VNHSPAAVSSVRQMILRRRLAIQRLVGSKLPTATDVVRLLTCVQSQECAHAFWSLGIRSSAATTAEVQAEFDSGRFLRTHILRPTWHLVPAEDIRWILKATSARIQQINSTIYRRENLDQAVLDRGAELITQVLRGRRYQTRAEIGEALAAAGLPAERLRLAYLIMNAELEGLICSGPMRGAQHTYALLDERAPSGGLRDDDLPELARRFLAGHGPASVPDFARWASLTSAQARAAVAEVAGELEAVEIDGVPNWFDPAAPGPASFDGALLLPLFDEVTLSYPVINFPLAEQHPHPPGSDVFIGSVIIAETNAGLWRRLVQGQKVLIEVILSPTVTPRSRAAVEAAAAELAAFLGKRLELAMSTRTQL